MRRSTSGAAVLGAAAVVAGLLVPAASAAPADEPSWRSLSSSWPVDGPLSVTDVVTTGRATFVTGNVGPEGAQRPVVQRCTARVCTAVDLPVFEDTTTTRVESITASSSDDVWAVGSMRWVGEHEDTAVSWRFDGSTWTVALPAPGNLQLLDVAAAGDGEVWATGLRDYEDGVTSTVYRNDDGVWAEVNSLSAPVFPEPCGSWWWNRWDDLTIRAGAPVLTGTCDDQPVVLTLVDGSWERIEDGLPAGPRWSEATVVGRKVWVAGASAGDVVIQYRAGSAWAPISTKGLPSGLTMSDLSGSRAGHVWIVGSTGGRAASWVWRGARWREVPVTAEGESRLVAVSAPGRSRAAAVGFDWGQAPDRAGVVLRER